MVEPLLGLSHELRERCLKMGASRAVRVCSEEARVWRLERPHAPPLWLKQHRHQGQARREEGVYHLLETLRERLREHLRSPQLLEGPSSHPERPRELLLTHLEGEVGFIDADALARGLYALHSAPLVAPDDPLPLAHALSKRIIQLTQQLTGQRDALVHLLAHLPLSLDERAGAQRGIKALCEFTPARFEALEQRFGLLSLLGGRSLCHRDLHPHNLTFSRKPSGALTLGLLDWGQARFDWWGVEWATLACRLEPASFQSAWVAYQGLLGLPKEAREALHECVLSLALRYALSTLMWGARHRDEQVKRRGVEELRRALTLGA